MTFFEYLRRRAFESIVAGVHEALETLDSEALPQAFTDSLRDPPLPRSRKLESNKQKPANSTATGTSTGEHGDLPAPRRRGRPPKKKPAS